MKIYISISSFCKCSLKALTLLSFVLVFYGCTKDSDPLPDTQDSWMNINGEYEGLTSVFYNDDTVEGWDRWENQIVKMTVKKIDDYYSIEFEENRIIGIPSLNLSIVRTELIQNDSEYLFGNIDVDIMENEFYEVNKMHGEIARFSVMIDHSGQFESRIEFGISMVSLTDKNIENVRIDATTYL